MSYCKRLTDNSLDLIASELTGLKALSLNGNFHMSGKAVVKLVEHSKCLDHLEVQGIPDFMTHDNKDLREKLIQSAVISNVVVKISAPLSPKDTTVARK